jgi:hypothetical protein
MDPEPKDSQLYAFELTVAIAVEELFLRYTEQGSYDMKGNKFVENEALFP